MTIAVNRHKNKKTSKLLKLTKETLKLAKKTALDDFALKMSQTKDENGGRLPKSFVSDIVKEMKAELPWLNQDKINYHYRTWVQQKVLPESENDVSAGTIDKKIESSSPFNL